MPGKANYIYHRRTPFSETQETPSRNDSLSQALIKITSPGFPDFYQGSEFWDLNLVDPDNRRPVDFSLRAWLFREMKSRETRKKSKLINELLSTRQDGRIKLYLIYKALAARQKQRNLFEKGNYAFFVISGCLEGDIIAFFKQVPLLLPGRKGFIY